MVDLLTTKTYISATGVLANDELFSIYMDRFRREIVHERVQMKNYTTF